MVATIMKWRKKWRTRPSNIVSKIVIPDEEESDEYLPKWDRMIKKEKAKGLNKNVKNLITPAQKALEEQLLQDIYDADDYELEVESNTSSYSMPSQKRKSGSPVAPERVLSPIQETFTSDDYEDSFNTPPGRRWSDESNVTIRRRTTFVPSPSTSFDSSSDDFNATIKRPRASTCLSDESNFSTPTLTPKHVRLSEIRAPVDRYEPKQFAILESNEERDEWEMPVRKLDFIAEEDEEEEPEDDAETTIISALETSLNLGKEESPVGQEANESIDLDETIKSTHTVLDKSLNMSRITSAKRSTLIRPSHGDLDQSIVPRRSSKKSILVPQKDVSIVEDQEIQEIKIDEIPEHPKQLETTAMEIEEAEKETEDVRVSEKIEQKQHRPFDVLLDYCEQDGILRWDDLPRSIYKNPNKLGEGTFGEVFEVTWQENDINEQVALKIMPFQDDIVSPYNELVNDDHLKKPEDILKELCLTKELSRLHETLEDKHGRKQMTTNFIRLVKAVVVQGNYPEPLLKAWDHYKEVNIRNKKKESFNERPDEYSADDRLFIIFALAKGGEDLDTFKVSGEAEGMSIFFQVALSLHVAERILQFEHRDLHVSNILVTRNPKFQQLDYLIDGKEVTLKTHGIKVDIIDYTYSRIYTDGRCVFADLSQDTELFEQPGRGEPKGNYQFEVYRKIRENNENKWMPYNPRSNVYWLHYLIWNLFLQKPRSMAVGVKGTRKVELERIFDETRMDQLENTTELMEDPEIVKLLNTHTMNGTTNDENRQPRTKR